MYGFGGKIKNDPEENSTSKCFALNGKIYSPECKGVNNVLGAYWSNFEKIEKGETCSYQPIIS